MRLFLGVEGGGSTTRAVLGRQDGMVVGRGQAGPSNPLFVGREQALQAVRTAVTIACHQYCPLLPVVCGAVAYCVPGARSGLAEESLRGLVTWEHLTVSGDVEPALRAGLGRRQGVVVSCGTGSFAVARGRDGTVAAVGGWGPLLGDEGSAYHMGLLGLQAVVRAHDGTGPLTALAAGLLGQLGVADVSGLRRIAYDGALSRHRIAGLAPVVVAVAARGDKVASSIVRAVARWMVILVRAAARKAGLTGKFPVVLMGGLAQAGPVLLEPFRDYLRRAMPSAVVGEPQFPSEVGSLLLAYEEGGVSLDAEAMDRLRSSWESSCEQG